MYILICGGGKVGLSLAKIFSARGHKVSLIERRLDKCQTIAQELDNVLVLNGDACDARYLEDAQINKVDVVAAVTGDDDDNLVICQLAKETYDVPRTVARVNDPRNESIFHELGFDAISSTTIIAQLIEEEVAVGDIITLHALKKGKLALVEVELPTTYCKVCDKKIADLNLPEECVLVAITRGDEVIIPTGSTMLENGDSVIALTSVDKEDELKEILI